MSGLSGMVYSGRRGRLLKTGQATCYAIGDDGDQQKGLARSYTVLSAGQYSGTTAIISAGYAAPTISFDTATKEIRDSASLLAVFKTGDIIVIRGSASNDGTYTVAAGNVAAKIVTTEALLADEAAGAYVKIYKRELHSNICVLDRNTGLMWSQTVSGLVGIASNGKLAWYDATKCYTLHPAAGDLQMIATTKTLRIVGGAAEVVRYAAGDRLEFSGFANAINNIAGGFRVVSVTVNGADLDIVIDPGNQTLVAEAAAGSRAIKLVCSSIWSYLAAAMQAQLAGYGDWRVATVNNGVSLMTWLAATGNVIPNATAFPVWAAGSNSIDHHWATTSPSNTANAVGSGFKGAVAPIVGGDNAKTNAGYCLLVRAGGA